MAEIFVLDYSVAAKWPLPEPNREPALELLHRQPDGEVILIAPEVLLAEFASYSPRDIAKTDFGGTGSRRLFVDGDLRTSFVRDPSGIASISRLQRSSSVLY